MSCLDNTAVLDFVAGQLGDEAHLRCEQHLQSCPSCRQVVSAYADLFLSARASPAAATPRPSLPVGATVERFVVLGRLGQGGMGEVYVAYDPELGRKVALKGVLGPLESAAQEHLRREAQAMAKLEHPHLARLYDVCSAGGQLYLTLELFEKSLRAWLAESPRSWQQVVAVLRQAGEGLAHVHAQGWIHRDFKPENVLLTRDGRAAVSDLGLLLAEPAEAGPHLAGTPAYLAPELFRGEPASAVSDQFAFCVTLFEALHGVRPFAGDSLPALRQAVLSGQVAPSRAKVPRWLDQLLRRGLSREPGARFPSMEALLRELGRERPRRWRLAAVGLAAVGAALWTGQRLATRAEPCAGAGMAMEASWGAPQRNEAKRAFASSGQPGAEEAFAAVEKQLDAYAGAWRRMSAQACMAARVRGTESDEMFTRRALCLDRRRERLQGLVDFLGRPAPTTPARALGLVSALPSLDGCADARALMAVAPLPQAPELQTRAKALRAALTQNQLVLSTEGPAPAQEAARRQVAEAQALGYAPLLADTQLVLAQVLGASGDPKGGTEALQGALWAAEAAGDDEAVVRAAVSLVYFQGYRQSDQSAGERWAKLARAVIARLGDRPDLLAELDYVQGTLLLDRQELEEAARRFERVVEARKRAQPPVPLNIAAATRALATARHAQGNLAETLRLRQENLELLRGAVGERTLVYAEELEQLASALDAHGRSEEATRHAEQALKTVRALVGEKHRRYGQALHQFGLVAYNAGRREEGVAALRQALALTSAEEGTLAAASSHYQLGMMLVQARHFDEGVEHLEKAIALHQKFSLAEHPIVGACHNGIGQAHFEQGRYRQALAKFQRALALRQKALGPHHYNVADDLVWLGRTQLSLDRPELARPPLEQAVAALGAAGAQPALLAEGRYYLAKALWPKERERAVGLAEEAERFFASKPDGAKERERVRGWLEKHPR